MSHQTQEVYIVGSARTAIGAFNGALSSLSAVELGVSAVKAALAKAAIEPSQVEELYLGNVLSANLGQNPAKQVAIGAGIPVETPCITINKVCASSLKAVNLAAQSIILGQADIVVAAGTESMSNVPHYIPKMRSGVKYGNTEIVDGLSRDGLSDAYEGYAMGIAAEQCATDHGFNREQQDDYALRSYRLAQEAINAGKFKQEIVPVEVAQGRGRPSKSSNKTRMPPNVIPRSCVKFVRPSSQTAQLPHPIAVHYPMVRSHCASIGEALKRLSLPPGTSVFRYLAGADAGQAPVKFTTSPSLALPKALKKAGIASDQVHAFEVNEAFSVVALANAKLLDIPLEKVNKHGGAVALGHPLGASGARILVTLCHILAQENGQYGVAGICNGGGGATATVIERLQG
ncbi:Thiolase, N-terminal domain-containing protein [Syncephalis fuscata]|nr:Thiolase, N-terminal domain-containing protein [Syncephalis fuscata]